MSVIKAKPVLLQRLKQQKKTELRKQKLMNTEVTVELFFFFSQRDIKKQGKREEEKEMGGICADGGGEGCLVAST